MNFFLDAQGRRGRRLPQLRCIGWWGPAVIALTWQTKSVPVFHECRRLILIVESERLTPRFKCSKSCNPDLRRDVAQNSARMAMATSGKPLAKAHLSCRDEPNEALCIRREEGLPLYRRLDARALLCHSRSLQG